MTYVILEPFLFDRGERQKGTEYAKDFSLKELVPGWLHLICLALETPIVPEGM